MADIPPYPLYNRTFTLHRLSPLHTGTTPLLDPAILQTHAQRLTRQLKGDTLRGVDLEATCETGFANLGPLENCTWKVLGNEDEWITQHRREWDPEASELSSSTAKTPDRARGINITLTYSNHAYNALLLRDPHTTTAPHAFTALPLLLLKMPAPLRAVVLKYLETTFDARVAVLRLPSTFLTSELESYFRRLASAQLVRHVMRQLQIQLAFPSVTSGCLKHVHVTIPGADVWAFVERGRQLAKPEQPFTAALETYLQKHIALNLAHRDVHVSKISCAAFTLATDRLKWTVPDSTDTASARSSPSGRGSAGEESQSQLALHDLYCSLVSEATGTGMFMEESVLETRGSETPLSGVSEEGTPRPRGTRRKRAVSSTKPGLPSKRSKGRVEGGEEGDVGVDELG